MIAQSLAESVSSKNFTNGGERAFTCPVTENACKGTSSANPVWDNVCTDTQPEGDGMATATSPERRYALIKIGAGDYLLPSNDGKTLWRIRRYLDGPSWGLDQLRNDRWFWCVNKWTGGEPGDDVGELYVDSVSVEGPNGSDEWECWSASHDTRREAIDDAMLAGEPKPSQRAGHPAHGLHRGLGIGALLAGGQ